MSAVGFTVSDIRGLAGPSSYERGLDYRDAVGRLRVESGRITATVQGTRRYKVVLHDEDGLRATCDCPYGEEGHFCKHCVAVALTVLEGPAAPSELRETAAAREAALHTWLESLNRDELLGLIRERLTADPDFKDALTLRAATAAGDTTQARATISALMDPADFSQYGYIAYEDAAGYADQVARAADAIRELAAAGQGSAALEAAREAIRRLTGVFESADDSDGSIGEAAAQLADAHLEACAAASPDPDDTAQWLVDHFLGEGGEFIDIDPADYRDVLGLQGLSTLRALGEEARLLNPSGWAEKALMESLARAEGDLDTLIAVHAADLTPGGYTHLIIAWELESAGRDAEALQWAERGLSHAAAEGEVADQRLIDYLAERYIRDGRTGDAVTLRRDYFRGNRSFTAYRALREAARTGGCWETERPEALDLLRADAEAGRKAPYGAGAVLIDALTEDGDLDAAWAAAPDWAGPGQLLRLADLSVDSRPADALAVYLRAVEARIGDTGDANYLEIADLLTKAGVCHAALGTLDAFTKYVADLRTEQRRKRNLLRILDQRGL